MWLHDLGEQPFSREDRKFLARAGRANVAVDVLLDRVRAIVGTERSTRGRQSFLAHTLVEERLFSDLDDALAFAEIYYVLAKAGRDFTYLAWDWE